MEAKTEGFLWSTAIGSWRPAAIQVLLTSFLGHTMGDKVWGCFRNERKAI